MLFSYLTSIAVGEWDEVVDRWKDVPLHYYVPRGRAEDIPRDA